MPRDNSEAKLQIAIVDLLTAAAAPGVRFFHVPNGGLRSKREASRFKKMGVMPGVPDLVISMPQGRMGFLELKSAKGVESEAQKGFLAAMEANGNLTAVVRDLDSAIAILTEWGAIRISWERISDNTSAPSCDDCFHMFRSLDWEKRCASPELFNSLGQSLRCVWERSASEDRPPKAYAAKCGPAGKNHKRREFV